MIIVSIVGPSMEQALEQVRSSARYADMYEFRLDLINEPPLWLLISSTRKPVIATCRSSNEGGGFEGTDEERLQILRAAIGLGADYVDVELRDGKSVLNEFIRSKANVIVSLHRFEQKRINVKSVYTRLRKSGAGILKFAYMAHDASDIHYAIEFLELARRDRQKAVAIAMGEAGEPSRVLYRKFGGWATYAAAETGDHAAPGQLKASMMKNLFRSDKLNSSTKLFGVVGNPVRQSKGIYVHNPLFQKAGKNSVYCRFVVHEISAFASRLAPFLNGFSVTLPHKQSVIKYLDNIDAIAGSIQAVNTVVFRNGKSFATNTDALGALDAIERTGKVAGKRILILGAGGAARAIAFDAKRRGAEILISNRTEGKAKQIAREFKIRHVQHKELASTEFDILVNATSVGMAPNVNESPVDKKLLRGKIVFDAVYNPPETKLLRDAESVGARIVPGTEMYLNQAVLQSQLYTGKKPSLALMRRLLG